MLTLNATGSKTPSPLLPFDSTTHFLNLMGIFEMGNQYVKEDAWCGYFMATHIPAHS